MVVFLVFMFRRAIILNLLRLLLGEFPGGGLLRYLKSLILFGLRIIGRILMAKSLSKLSRIIIKTVCHQTYQHQIMYPCQTTYPHHIICLTLIKALLFLNPKKIPYLRRPKNSQQ